MKVFLDRKSIGFDRDVLVDGESIRFELVDARPTGYWHLQESAYLSLDRVSQAVGINIDNVPNDARVTWWSQFDRPCRYDLIMGKDRFVSFLKHVINQAKSVISSSDYFTGAYQRQNVLLDLLTPAHIRKNDPETLECAIDLGIKFDANGECVIASYDNFSSSTGRMSIKDGPKILTMNKQHRHVFTSKWGDAGVLLGIDYNALEPRFLLGVMGVDTSKMDVYKHIGTEARIPEVARETLKTMILACLYGMSRRNFIVKFIDTSDSDVIYDSLRSVLGVDHMIDKIKDNMTGGKVKNYFGRPLSCDNESLILNHFTQSSAVDVACDGFLEFVTGMRDCVDPVFLIHDELVIDIHKDSLEKVVDFCKNGLYVPSLKMNFPVKTKVFNARKDNQ